MAMSELIQQLLKAKNWKDLNDIQKEAVSLGILNGKGNFLVFAPTGSGKTGIAELAIFQELQKGGKAIYAVPSHALVEDKIKDFQYLTALGYKVAEGGSTLSQWKNTDVNVTTFELLYRACLFSKEFIKDFKIVIIDEFHILYDATRGYTLEKLLTTLKDGSARLFCISATFEDKKEVSEWLNAKIAEIPNKLRVVPIDYFKVDLSTKGSISLAESIIQAKNEPCLIFCATKPATKDRAEELSKLLKIKKNDKNTSIEDLKKILNRDDLPELEMCLCDCLEMGVGFHHSDLTAEVREYVANLFMERKIDYLFCTTGLAYGVNFPAKSVFVADLSLYDPEEKRSNPIPTHMFLQMAGRAGRPKFGNKGYCYAVIKKEEDFAQLEEYMSGHLTKAYSHISRDDFFYKAILELIYSLRNTDAEITSFFQNSLFNFQASRQKDLMVPFDLKESIKRRMIALNSAGFIEQMGVQYKLTKFGEITLDYLFSGVSSPELISFIMLNKYVQSKGLQTDFDYIYFLSKQFPDCRISKQPRGKSDEVEAFLQSKGIKDRAHPEYSAYVVYKKWMENVNDVKKDLILIEYFVSDDRIFIFAISPKEKEFQVKTVPIPRQNLRDIIKIICRM